jgi:hypothetical protein
MNTRNRKIIFLGSRVLPVLRAGNLTAICEEVNTTEELLGRKSSGFGIEIREYGRRDKSL